MKSSWISVRAVLEAGELAGVPREQLRNAAGLDLADTHDAYGWVDGARYDALLESAVALTGTPTFGLRWAGMSPMVQFELLPLLVVNAPTLGQSLDATLALQAILHELPQTEILKEQQSVIVRATPAPQMSSIASRVSTDLSMGGLYRLFDYVFRGSVPEAVHFSFAYAPDAHEGEYQAMFGRQVAFGAAHSEVRMPIDLLDEPNPTHNAELFHALLQQLALLRARMVSRLTYTERVIAELRAALPRLLEMTAAARALGMGERSLRRRLADEGTSYSEVVERAQVELARERLRDPQMSIKAVAFAVGFDTTSGFRRAFKRRTGLNPASFRARDQENE